jgi:hypothetical protein
LGQAARTNARLDRAAKRRTSIEILRWRAHAARNNRFIVRTLRRGRNPGHETRAFARVFDTTRSQFTPYIDHRAFRFTVL